MKKSIKRLSSIVSMAAIISTTFGANMVSAQTTLSPYNENSRLEAAGTAAESDGMYATNPNDGVGKNKTISSFADWTEDCLIAQGEANDDPRVYRPNSMYEIPWDLYSLYGAWDDKNVYLMWQYVNVQDVVAPGDDYPLTGNGKPYVSDVPQVLAFNIDPNKGATGGTLPAKNNYVWGCPIDFTTKVDKTMYFSTKPGVGEPAIFSAGSDGKFDDSASGPVAFKDVGITYSYEDGFLGSKMYGVDKGYGTKNNRVPGDGSTATLVDFIEKGHDTKHDTKYMITIPYEALGIDKNYLETNGIGVMFLSTFGLSAMDCLPYDPSMYDNADLDDTEASQENNSREKSDKDNITVPLASLGKLREPGTGKVDPPITKDPVINDLTKDKKEVVVGDEVKFTCDANDATSYSFTIDGKAVDESEVSKNVLTHKFDKEGTYKVAVTAKGATGTKDATKEIEVKVNTAGDDPEPGDFEISKFTASPKDSCEVEDSVKLEASATGEDEYEYKFTVVDEDDEETVIQDYSSKVVATWTPEDEGSYTLRVYAKVDGSEDSTAISKDIENFEVTAKSETKKLTMDSFDADVEEGTIEPNKEVVFTAEASGSDDITYKYTISKDGGDEEDLESSDGEATWNPDEEGTYVIKVIASKDGYKDAIGTKTYVVKAKEDKSLIAKISTKAKLQQKLGNSVKFTADSENAEGDVTYKFIVNNEKSEYSDKKFSSVLSYDFEPEEAGEYEVYVIAKDKETGEEKVSNKIKITFKDNSSTEEKISTEIDLSNKTLTAGDTLTITPSTKNAKGSVTYQLLIDGEETGKVVVDDKLSWTAEKAGKYKVSVKATDEEGNEAVSDEISVTVKEKESKPDTPGENPGDKPGEDSPTADNTPVKALGILGILGSAIAVLSRKKQNN
ncbi:MAG: hypothetical protein GX309_07515 [Clostridiales bacterium]|nr:hypothetical protein [Clostridiales bacterium]